MALYIAPAALGLGDLVVALPVVQQLIARESAVYLVLRAEEHADLARRIPGLAGTRLEWELPDCLSAADRFIDLRDHPLEKVAWWGSKPWLDAYPGWTINDILATICADKQIPVDLNAPFSPLKFVRRPALADKLLLIPGSAVSAKCWPAINWLQLSSRFDAVVIGQPDQSAEVAALVNAGVPWFETPTVADALDAVSSCKAVLSVDTGIMHLAVHQGTPTAAVFRWSPVYARQCDNFVPVVAARPCESVCYEREVGMGHNGKPTAGKDFKPNNWSCLAGQLGCMSTIQLADVLAALDAAINLRGRRHLQTGTHRLPVRF